MSKGARLRQSKIKKKEEIKSTLESMFGHQVDMVGSPSEIKEVTDLKLVIKEINEVKERDYEQSLNLTEYVNNLVEMEKSEKGFMELMGCELISGFKNKELWYEYYTINGNGSTLENSINGQYE